MGIEINLLENYPKSKRDVNQRGNNKSKKDKLIAQKFGKEFFDGKRNQGYGGFYYNPKYWEPVVPSFIEHFKIKDNNKILDIGCAKGFMLYDFKKLMPDLNIKGIDISQYAIENSMPEIRSYLEIADAKSLNFGDNSYDFVISINTIHNLEYEECINAILEIERVSKVNSFIMVDAYRNDLEKDRMMNWNLTAKTILHVEEWKKLFNDIGYTGDYFWFIP